MTNVEELFAKEPTKVKARDGVDILVYCAFTHLLPIDLLETLRNPNNTNDHPETQVDELIEQYKFQGIRHPIILSARDRTFAAGDGRFLAAKKLGMQSFPVDVQPWQSEEQQFAFGVADNELQKWSITNLRQVHLQLPNQAPFEIPRLGIRGFQFEPTPGVLKSAQDEWNASGMPGFENKKAVYRSIMIHFKDEEAVQDFQNIMAQHVSPKTRYLWHPKMEVFEASAFAYEKNES